MGALAQVASIDFCEELRRGDFESLGQLEDRVQGRFALAALDSSDGGLVNSSRPAKLLLRQAASLTQPLDIGGKLRSGTSRAGGHSASFATAE